jgi:hypothetical protein
MRLILGPNDITQEGLGYIAHIFYDLGLLYVGLTIGSIVAVLFIIVDYYILRQWLKNNLKSFSVRFMVIVFVTMFCGGIHYLLEKELDVI